MVYPHIKASEVRVGAFYLAAKPDWPYVREVVDIAEGSVMYNDYAYHTGEPGLVNKGCRISRFAAWAGRELTNDEAARMKSVEGHALSHLQVVVQAVTTSAGRKLVASILANAVRNAIEDFHAANTEQTIKNTDEYMPEFNRTVRNAIYTGLHALLYEGGDKPTRHYAAFISSVPDYWEEPELILSEPDNSE